MISTVPMTEIAEVLSKDDNSVVDFTIHCGQQTVNQSSYNLGEEDGTEETADSITLLTMNVPSLTATNLSGRDVHLPLSYGRSRLFNIFSVTISPDRVHALITLVG